MKEDITADSEESKTEVYSGHNRLMTTNNEHYFPFLLQLPVSNYGFFCEEEKHKKNTKM